MHVRLIAVGNRQPPWVTQGFEEYAKRLPRPWRFRLEELPVAARRGVEPRDFEGRKILQKLRPGETMVALDERGSEMSSVELSGRLSGWLAAGSDLAFVIGGPDGLAGACLERADFRWSLSRHTLPHGLARVMLVEQLYRAWTLAEGHPYHRA